MIVDIIVFQDQALDVRKELEATHKILLTKVENVQHHFWVIDQALNNICLREREVISSQIPSKKQLCHQQKKE
jgi:hypothetical protein